jgi:putative ABC transport system substrate-binding protein
MLFVACTLPCFFAPAVASAAPTSDPEQVPALAQDGLGLFNQTAETQATFAAVWGDDSSTEWIREHDAALSAGQSPDGPRIGFLYSGTREQNPLFTQGIVEGLTQVGYQPGQTMSIIWRFADGHPDRLPSLAAELIEQHPDVVVAPTTAEATALETLTKTIPIVTMTAGDPVGNGLVKDLELPGTNVTGVIQQPLSFNRERLALLQQAVPRARRIAVLANVTSGDDPSLVALSSNAAALGLDLQLLPVTSADELPAAFAAASGQSADAMMVLAGTLFTANRLQIAQLAAKHGLPTLYPSRLFVEAGGLMDYAFIEGERGSVAARYIADILHGADPARLSMTPPPDIELVVNMSAAQSIGYSVPAAIAARATDLLP